MTPDRYPRIFPATESAVLVEFGESIDYGVNARVYALQAVVDDSDWSDVVVEMIPTFRSILIEYDFTESSFAEMQGRLEVALQDVEDAGDANRGASVGVHDLPVAYGGEHGPDLDMVADHAGMTNDEVVQIHSDAEYRVFMLGFSPGFPYLGGMDERIACPRLATPRLKVAAGSVGIAESQTGIYPNESPGGWQIIGRSPSILFDVTSEPPSTLLPGSVVRFVPISHDEFQRLSSASEEA